MHSKLANQSVIGHHLGGELRWYDDLFLSGQNIEVVWIEDELPL